MVRKVAHASFRMPWMFGMITAMVRVEHDTRATSSPSAFGMTSATFQVCAGTAT